MQELVKTRFDLFPRCKVHCSQLTTAMTDQSTSFIPFIYFIVFCRIKFVFVFVFVFLFVCCIWIWINMFSPTPQFLVNAGRDTLRDKRLIVSNGPWDSSRHCTKCSSRLIFGKSMRHIIAHLSLCRGISRYIKSAHDKPEMHCAWQIISNGPWDWLSASRSISSVIDNRSPLCTSNYPLT